MYIYFWSEGTLSAVYSKLCKGENQILFMNECWCKPGYEENSLHDSCHSPILKIADCECEPLNVDRNFLQNATWGVNNDWSPPGN